MSDLTKRPQDSSCIVIIVQRMLDKMYCVSRLKLKLTSSRVIFNLYGQPRSGGGVGVGKTLCTTTLREWIAEHKVRSVLFWKCLSRNDRERGGVIYLSRKQYI